MGCGGSTDVSNLLNKSKGLINLPTQKVSRFIDQFMIEEVLFIREKLKNITKSEIKKSFKTQQKLQLVRIDADLIGNLYFQSNKGNTQQIFQFGKQQDTRNQNITPDHKAKTYRVQDSQIKENNVIIPQNFYQNIVVFFKNGFKQSFITFFEFIRQYAILIKSDIRSQQWIQILYALLSQGTRQISRNQFISFLDMLNIFPEDIQKFYAQKNGNQTFFILPTIIQKLKFSQIISLMQMSKQFVERFRKFQYSLNFIKNQDLSTQSQFSLMKFIITSQYRKLQQLLAAEAQNLGKLQFTASSEVYIISRVWYQEFVDILNQFLDFYQGLKLKRNPSNSLNDIKTISVAKKAKYNLASLKQIVSVKPSNSYIRLNQIKIDYSLVEGEYQLELKEGIKIDKQIKVISSKVYAGVIELLNNVQRKFRQINSQQIKISYPRQLLNSGQVQLVPLMIYLIQTNNKTGKLNYETLQSLLVQHNQKLSDLKNRITLLQTSSQLIQQSDQQSNISFFSKIFEQKNFHQQLDLNIKFHKLQIKSRKLLIVMTSNRIGFIQKYTRKQITKQNLLVGDKILAYSQGQKKYLPAYIVNKLQEQNSVRVHFVNKSWREQLIIKIQTVYIKFTDIEDQKQRPKEYCQLFMGLKNVGNTCYINSSIQTLFSTEIFSQLLSVQPINKRSFSYLLIKMFNLLNQKLKKSYNIEKISEGEFKQRISTQFLTQFSGCYQHDTQQFIHAVLNKLTEQQGDFIKNIFEFNTQNELICQSSSCDFKKINYETMSMITLPIPQPEYVYIQIMLVPIYYQKMQKIFIKLQQNATVGQLLRKFEQRSNSQRKKFIFVQTQNGNIKKIRKDLNQCPNEQTPIKDLGIISNIKLAAYQLTKQIKINDLIKHSQRLKDKKNFHDFYIEQQKLWTVAKIELNNNEPLQHVEYANLEKQIVKIKVSTKQLQNKSFIIQNLGTRTNQNGTRIFKIIQRKLSKALVGTGRTIQSFGIQTIVSLPLWCSQYEAKILIQEQIKNFKNNNAQNQKDYIIRFLQPKRQKCIFCQSQISKNYESQDQIKKCCKVLQSDHPLVFTAKIQFFIIYIDWLTIQNYRSQFSSLLTMDRACKNTQDQYQQYKVSLHECFKMIRHKQQVEMQCDKCKHPKMSRQQSISSLPIILIIQLKQYRYVQNSQTMIKIATNLNFSQIKEINLQSYLPERSVIKDSLNFDASYQLYSVIQHVGSGNSGHYTAICKRKFQNQQNNQYSKQVWVHFDDDYSQFIEQNEVKNFMDNAYMLFYRKKFLGTQNRLRLNLL